MIMINNHQELQAELLVTPVVASHIRSLTMKLENILIIQKQSKRRIWRSKKTSRQTSALCVGDGARQSVQQCAQQDANRISPGNWLSLHESQMTFTRRLSGLVDSASISSGTPTCFQPPPPFPLSDPFSPVSSSTVRFRTNLLLSLSPLTRRTLGSLWQTERLTGIQEYQDRKSEGGRRKPQAAWMASRSASLTGADVSAALRVFFFIFYFTLTEQPWLVFFQQDTLTKLTDSFNWSETNDRNCRIVRDAWPRLLPGCSLLSFLAATSLISLFASIHPNIKINLHKQTHRCALVFA